MLFSSAVYISYKREAHTHALTFVKTRLDMIDNQAGCGEASLRPYNYYPTRKKKEI